MDSNVIIVVIVSMISSIVTYQIAKRKTSGSIDTSEAATLWAESQAMRKELRDEVVDLRKKLLEAQDDIIALRSRVKELEDKA